MKGNKLGRRRFLKGGAAAIGGLAAAGVGTASAQDRGTKLIQDFDIRPIGEVSRFERKVIRRGFNGGINDGLTPHQDLHGMITPNELHYYVNHESGATPDIDPQEFRLLIHGMVDHPVELTLDEIKRLPAVSRILFVECNGNSSDIFNKNAKTAQDVHGRASCAEWTGVPLSLLLKEVGVKKGADWVLFFAADPSHHGHTLPLEKAMDDAILAYGQNGEALRLENGYPLRLILPGWSGRINVKWLNRIKLDNEPYFDRQETFAYMPQGAAGMGAYTYAGTKAFALHHLSYVKSVITFPSGGQRIPKPGMYEITGLSWSGFGVVKKVEISVDNGKTWQLAKLQDPILPMAFTRFRFPWKWDGSEVILQSRATDEGGNVQPTPQQFHGTARPSAQQMDIWGSDNSQTCRNFLNDELCSHLPVRAQRSIIQSWKVNKDGTVINPMPLIANTVAPFLLQDEHEH